MLSAHQRRGRSAARPRASSRQPDETPVIDLTSYWAPPRTTCLPYGCRCSTAMPSVESRPASQTPLRDPSGFMPLVSLYWGPVDLSRGRHSREHSPNVQSQPVVRSIEVSGPYTRVWREKGITMGGGGWCRGGRAPFASVTPRRGGGLRYGDLTRVFHSRTFSEHDRTSVHHNDLRRVLGHHLMPTDASLAPSTTPTDVSNCGPVTPMVAL